MSVFRLEPIGDRRDSHHWKASTLAPVTVWVQAENEEAARQTLTGATIIASIIESRNADIPMAPWENPGLVRCLADDTRRVEEGEIQIADGRKLVIADL